ncbi:MAG: hypothetical protein AAB372_03535 [Patescibacteria group bacterium]
MSQRTKHAFLILFITLGLGTWTGGYRFIEFPKYWWDESFTIEIARTVLETGRVDITIAPHTPSNIAIALSANGFPMSLPLALMFHIFGIGIFQARLYMLLWLIGGALTLWLLLRKFFDGTDAILAMLPVITFASFYANGRTATGDIPGFLFFTLGIGMIIAEERYVFGGLLLGLATVTKTSLYHMALPAIFFWWLLRARSLGIRPILKIASSAACVGILWFLLLLPRPYAFSQIMPALEFYKNPINKPSLLMRMPQSLTEIFGSTTIIYLLGICILITWARVRNGFSKTQRNFITYVGIYSILQLIVFLRSPGWHRYLLAVELLLLSVLYPSLVAILGTSRKRLATFATLLLACIQTGHYILASSIFPHKNPELQASHIQTLLEANPGSTVGFVDNPMTAALISGNQKYQRVHVGGQTYAGRHPLDLPQDQLPTFFVPPVDDEHAIIINTLYTPIESDDGFIIYKKKD